MALRIKPQPSKALREGLLMAAFYAGMITAFIYLAPYIFTWIIERAVDFANFVYAVTEGKRL